MDTVLLRVGSVMSGSEHREPDNVEDSVPMLGYRSIVIILEDFEGRKAT